MPRYRYHIRPEWYVKYEDGDEQELVCRAELEVFYHGSSGRAVLPSPYANPMSLVDAIARLERDK